MRKIIWTCWLQGRRHAPFLVQKCLDSWQAQNPNWDFRCLDAYTIRRYVDIDAYIDLQSQKVTAASLSDILRIALLHEYGGVWVDATLFCNQPLDEWLPPSLVAGFFAFCEPAPDRMLSSWFLAALPGHPLVASWASCVAEYWSDREQTDDYFWFHHLFGDLYETDDEFRRIWNTVPRTKAAATAGLNFADIFNRNGTLDEAGVDSSIPVFKLTHRLDMDAVRLEALRPGGVLFKLLARHGPIPESQSRPSADVVPTSFVGLKTNTEHLGDYIQIIAADNFLKRVGVEVNYHIDRYDEIISAPALSSIPSSVGLLINGCYQNAPSEWPSNPIVVPMYLGFHVQFFQSQSLLSEAALEHYRTHGPIGCRDHYTLALLRAHDVDAFLSNCLTMSIPRRFVRAETQSEVFIVSNNETILSYIPESIGKFTFFNYCSETSCFDDNIKLATELLLKYRTSARIIVTTLLHCALPAMAMGIPVVVFYPENPDQLCKSDREGFSTLERMVRVHKFSEAHAVNWTGQVVDAGFWKLGLIDAFFQMAERWNLSEPALAPIAPSELLPLPTQQAVDRLMMSRAPSARTPDRAQGRSR